MNHAGRGRPGQLDAAGARPADTAPADTAAPGDVGTQSTAASPSPELHGSEPPGGRLRSAVSRPVVRHLALLVVYLAAGIALTWPRATYLSRHLLPETRDVSGYVWDLWWTAHQVVHLGNPWFTSRMAAPVGIQLGFDTTMPLAGLIMTPVTLAFGPSASFDVLTILVPGLVCYLMYRAARLWLAEPGAIAAGALFGLSSMLGWQDWQHLNIALGTVFLPMTLEAAVRLRRRPGARQGIILGVVLGGSVLVNQESAVMAVLLAAVALLPWLARNPAVARLRALGWGVVAALVVASPQLIAMIQQAAAGGASVSGRTLAHTGKTYGVGLFDLFAPSQRVASYGLAGVAHAAADSAGRIGEGMPMFGVVLTVLALFGLAVTWRRRTAWLLAALWLGCAWLALGAVLWIGRKPHVPFLARWYGQRVSLIMPYTYFMRIPWLSDLREADRFALLGLVGAVLLAGAAVDWIWRHAWPAVVVVAALAVFEAGWAGSSAIGVMPTTLPALDRPIAADHSNSIVVDAPFGLRGGIPLYGGQFAAQSLVLATSDGHPRAVSYTSWVPAATIGGIKKHVFYTLLVSSSNYIAGTPVVLKASPAELAAARRDARRMDIGWVLVWTKNPLIARYLVATGFRFDYRADGAAVYRPAS
jgi:4-amino-4-deoxy-L-arabinose transferase-like glycosyltransferase